MSSSNNLSWVTAKSFFISSFTLDNRVVPLLPIDERSPGTKVSVLIGPNGSGKSSVVAALIDELELLYQLKGGQPSSKWKRLQRKADRSTIKYRYGDDECEIERDGSRIICHMNGKSVSAESIPFPNAAFAVAHLPADRFRFSKNLDEDFYFYLGLRQSTNLTTTGALEAKVIASLIRGLARPTYEQSLAHWLGLLNVGGNFHLEINFGRYELYEDFTEDSLHSVIGSINEEGDIKALQSSSDPRISKFKTSDIYLLLDFMRKVFHPVSGRKRRTWSADIRAMLALKNVEPQFWETGLEVLRKLRILSRVNLLLSKNGRQVEFASLSSGEQQVIGTLSRLLGEIRPNSVIVIDEPEVSLHPSWQMRYIPTLLEALKEVPSLHIIIATHSHFMVSDIEEGTASLTQAIGSDGNRFELYDGELYGRSPENILYRVFGVGAVSNFYVEQDLARALEMVAFPDGLEKEELLTIRARLDKASTSEGNTALDEILREIDMVLEDAKDA